MKWIFGFFITFFTFWLSKRLYSHYRNFITHPVLLPSILIVLFIEIFRIDFNTYWEGGRVFIFFLNPATVALAYLLYKKWDIIKRYFFEIISTVTLSSIIGILIAYLFVKIVGGTEVVALSMVSKSITTPIAVRVSEVVGGVPSLTAVFVIITGIEGALLGPLFLKIFKIDHPIVWGISMGITSHGIGTARAVEEGILQGAASGVGFILMGIATAIFAPYVIWVVELFIKK